MTDALVPKLAEPKAVLDGLVGATADDSEGMSYLETLPRRLVTLYLPLSLILVVLLFPFYWMALTAIKPDEQLLDLERFNPFWTWTPTLQAHRQAAVRDQLSAMAVEHHAGRHCGDHSVDRRERARGLRDRAPALPRSAVDRRRHLSRLPDPALDPVHPAVDRRLSVRVVRHAVRADPDLPDDPDSVFDLAADGLFQDHSVRARGMRADRWRQPLANSRQASSCRWRCRG